MRTQRNERVARELASLEQDFRAKLLLALEKCANGQWGLFGHNDHLPGAERWNRDPGVAELLELGAAIEDIRHRLRLEPNVLFAQLQSLRGRAESNAPGESKKALAWLAELKHQS